MFEYLFNLFLVAWEMMCCRLFFEIFVARRYKNTVITKGIFLGLILTEYLCIYLLYHVLLIKIIAVILLITIAMALLFEVKIPKALVLTVLYQGIGIVCDYTVILFLWKLFPQIQSEQMASIGVSSMVTIISKVILLFSIMIIRRICQKQTDDMLTETEWLVLLVIPVITILSIVGMILKFDVLGNEVQDDTLLYIAVGMAVMNITVFALMESVFKRERIIRENRVLAEKAKGEMEMYYSLSANLDNQRKLTHEFKNHLACIGELLHQGSTQELREYYEKVNKELVVKADMVDTNHIIVNAVINTKYREAVEKGIVFVLKVNDLSMLTLSDLEIVTILANLLNNAIEASEYCENKVIKLKFVIENGQTLISVKNNIKVEPIQRGDTLLTTKTDMPEEHGIGMKNIREVVERHHGRMLVDYDETEFTVTIIF